MSARNILTNFQKYFLIPIVHMNYIGLYHLVQKIHTAFFMRAKVFIFPGHRVGSYPISENHLLRKCMMIAVLKEEI